MFNMDGTNGHRCPLLDSAGVPLNLGGSPSSGNGSDMFLYDDSSISDSSLYASDQENLSTPRKRYVYVLVTNNELTTMNLYKTYTYLLF